MLSETSGDFADVPEHPERIPTTINASSPTDNLSVFMFSSEGEGTHFTRAGCQRLCRFSLVVLALLCPGRNPDGRDILVGVSCAVVRCHSFFNRDRDDYGASSSIGSAFCGFVWHTHDTSGDVR